MLQTEFYLLRGDIPLVCLRFHERKEEEANRHHDLVELAGGPEDGVKVQEIGKRVDYNPETLYAINGHIYRPWKIVARDSKRVLVLMHQGTV